PAPSIWMCMFCPISVKVTFSICGVGPLGSSAGGALGFNLPVQMANSGPGLFCTKMDTLSSSATLYGLPYCNPNPSTTISVSVQDVYCRYTGQPGFPAHQAAVASVMEN